MVKKEDVMTQLDEVEDPELELSIVELGLVYDVRFETTRPRCRFRRTSDCQG